MTETELRDILYNNAKKIRTAEELAQEANEMTAGVLFKKISLSLQGKSTSKEAYLIMEHCKDIFLIIDGQIAKTEYLKDNIIKNENLDKVKATELQIVFNGYKDFAENLKNKIREYYFV